MRSQRRLCRGVTKDPLHPVPPHYSIQRRICKLSGVSGPRLSFAEMPFKLALFLAIAAAVFKDRADLVAENVALRHQLSCLVHRGPRPKLRPVDRVFWVLLSRYWSGWKESLAVVKPATGVAWHRKGFKLFWR